MLREPTQGVLSVIVSDTFVIPHKHYVMPSLCYDVTSHTQEDE